ncbi:bacteriohemerythrin [Mariprofundus sp. KV]|uniref:GGDEF domain-containing protein n=1 Tax=Mariprofundus sp. KV TaxID=2608715 RepID=UPI0015A2569D|nr:bacteriohemerythrin [Mariprofundus sp. KV]NWF37121.1 bacteriohemerythrin [Mariprofundus sp. KV]
MESFHWDDHFVTGLDEVDQQHHRLVDMVNQFGALLSENEVDADALESLFNKLAEYAVYHFKEEERLMVEFSIDQRHISNHMEVHQKFVEEVMTMHKGITAENPEGASNLLSFLTHWLAYHILGLDQNMVRQIRAIQAGSTPALAYQAEEKQLDSATEPLLVALDALFYQVSERNRELSLLNQSLEAKVEERTRELSEANLKLEELSLTDALTDLPNRRYGMLCLAERWDESLTNDTPLVCMIVDADHFKEINDTYGHDAGDSVLIELAKTVQNAVRESDMVCRLGGDEFIIICPDTSFDDGMAIAEQIRKSVSELEVVAGDGVWHGSISVGLASRTAAMNSYEKLIKSADLSVYEAKRDGKNCVRAVESR